MIKNCFDSATAGTMTVSIPSTVSPTDLTTLQDGVTAAKKNQFQETIVEEVVEMARDKENWQIEANALQRKPRTDISLESTTYNIKVAILK